jgi:hypothetical protein
MKRLPGKMTTTPATAANAPKLPGQATGPPSIAAARQGAQTAVAAGQVASLVQRLTTRLDALEAQLQLLQTSTLQQWPDGRVHLPAVNRLHIEIGNTRLTMDMATFTVEANGQVIVSARPLMQPQMTSQQGGSLQSLAAQAGSGSWQSQAHQSGVEDPRHPAPGYRINTNP